MSKGRISQPTLSRSVAGGRRAGFTLVDTVTMVIAVGALLSLSTVVLHQSFKAHRHALAELRVLQHLRLIGDRFRSDAARADRFEISDTLEFEFPDQRRVSYEVVDGEIRRSIWSEQGLVGRDEWKLPGACEPSFESEKQERTSLIIFRLEFQNSGYMPALEWIARMSQSIEDNTNSTDAEQ